MCVNYTRDCIAREILMVSVWEHAAATSRVVKLWAAREGNEVCIAFWTEKVFFHLLTWKKPLNIEKKQYLAPRLNPPSAKIGWKMPQPQRWWNMAGVWLLFNHFLLSSSSLHTTSHIINGSYEHNESHTVPCRAAIVGMGVWNCCIWRLYYIIIHPTV